MDEELQTEENCNCEENKKTINKLTSLLATQQKQIEDLQRQIKTLGGTIDNNNGQSTGNTDNYGNACLTEDAEKIWLIANATSQRHIANLYNKSNRKRRCFSSIDIHKLFGGDGKGSERKMSTYVWEQILKIRE